MKKPMNRTLLAAIGLFVLFQGLATAAQRENTLLNLSVPSGLEDNTMYFEFAHKYYFDMNHYNHSNDDLLSPISQGANVHIGLRYMIGSGLEADAGYTTLQKEKLLGASYSRDFSEYYFGARLGMQFFSFDLPVNAEVRQNLFYSLTLQSAAFWDVFTITISPAYDGLSEKLGLGFGLSVKPLDAVSFMAEYYPVLSAQHTEEPLQHPAWFLGIKTVTFGHQFVLMLGNSVQMGPRRLMEGTSGQELHLAFNIQRLFEF